MLHAPRRSKLEQFPVALLIAATVIVFGAVGSNIFLTIFAFVELLVGVWLLQRPGESPILLLIFCFQWLQASTKIFYANWQGVSVETLTPTGDVETAIVLSLCAVIALALGLRLGAGKTNPTMGEFVFSVSQRRSPKDWFYLYVPILIVTSIAQNFAWVVPGLTQPILAVANIKWAFYWMLTYATFANAGASRRYWYVAFCIELLLSLGTYFADFKTVFLFTLLGMLAVPVRWSLTRYASVTAFAVLLVLYAWVWTAIKEEYRFFVNGGGFDQVVTMGFGDRITKLVELTTQLDSQKLDVAVESLVNRVAYVDLFAVIVQQVPAVIPHEDGAVWWDAITRVFMPRLLFPDKPGIDDSIRANLFGLDVSGREEGTSIGIGYIAETYIDFGKVTMMLVIFSFGIVLGRIYHWLLFKPPYRGFLGMALATNLLYSILLVEVSITKLIGGLVITLLASWLTARVLVPMFAPWLSAAPDTISAGARS